MTDGGVPPTSPRRFTPLDDPEPPPRSPRWWLLTAAGIVVVIAITVTAIAHHSSSSDKPARTPSASAAVRLPPGARPLPGAFGAGAQSFGVLGPVDKQRARITRSQAVRRYDHIPGVVSRGGSRRRLFTALVRAAFIDRGRVRQDTFWVVSVWFHPPDIGVSAQKQWCVNNGLVNATTGADDGYVSGCLPRGESPRAAA